MYREKEIVEKVKNLIDNMRVIPFDIMCDAYILGERIYISNEGLYFRSDRIKIPNVQLTTLLNLVKEKNMAVDEEEHQKIIDQFLKE